MRQHALQLQANQTDRLAARWHGYPKRVLDGLAICHRVREAVIAGDRFGHHRTVADGSALEQLLRPFVGIEVAQLQVEHRVADHAEPKMAGLDDAGMDWAHRHLAHTFALHSQERVLPLCPRHKAGVVHHGMDAVGPILMQQERPQIGMPLDLHSVLVVQFTLVPRRRRADTGCGWNRPRRHRGK